MLQPCACHPHAYASVLLLQIAGLHQLPGGSKQEALRMLEHIGWQHAFQKAPVLATPAML